MLFFTGLLLSCRAYADDTSYTDLHDSQQAYGAYVSSLNKAAFTAAEEKEFLQYHMYPAMERVSVPFSPVMSTGSPEREILSARTS